MTDLDVLRPEVREAVQELDGKAYPGSRTHERWQIIRAELLRLAMIETDALIALDCEHDWQVMRERAEKAEAELAESRETIKRLNRRVQVAEAGVAERVKVSAPGSLGRGLANAAADAFMHERDEARAELAALKARIAEAPTAQLIDRGRATQQWYVRATDGGLLALPPALSGKRVRLVVEE